MARPSKSADVIIEEGKSHRTKAELRQRKSAENAAFTGLPMKENKIVSNNKISHTEFIRVKKLMVAIGKDDAIFESVINDYCEYKADIARYREMRIELENALRDLEDASIDYGVKIRLKTQLYDKIIDCDKQIQSFQKKRFDIEKENGFTLASSVRNIPKSSSKEENPLKKVLQGGTG